MDHDEQAKGTGPSAEPEHGAAGGDGRGTGPGGAEPRMIQSVATTDPAVTLIAAHQPQWMQHPEASWSLLTSQMSAPAPLSFAIPELSAIAELGWPWEPQAVARATRLTEPVPQVHQPDRPRRWSGRFAWLIVAAALAGGVIAALTYRRVTRA